MARQVFFDPFGSYTRGFDMGAQRQMGMEDSVRRARMQDYDYNVLQPYRTAAIQRQDQFDTKALPYREGMLPIGYQNARTNSALEQFRLGQLGAQTFGTADPLYRFGRQAFGYQFGTTGDPVNGFNTTIYAPGPDGRMVPIMQRPNYGQEVLNNGANWDRALKEQEVRNQALMYGARGDFYTQDAIARQTAANAAMLRAQNAGVGGQYAPSGAGFAGFGGGMGVTYPGYDPMNDYNIPNQ